MRGNGYRNGTDGITRRDAGGYSTRTGSVAGSSVGSASGFRTGFRFLTNGYSSPTDEDAFFVVASTDGSFYKQGAGGSVFASIAGAGGTTAR